MNASRFIIGSTLLLLAGCQHIGGEGMPTVTRTGVVKDVIIREDISPATLTVNPGDEIRWINKRQGKARVVFIDPVTEMLSCQRNFGGFGGFGVKRNQYTASLGSNDTASACFRSPSQVKYVVRADSNLPAGEENIPGTITIGSETDQSSAAQPQPTVEQRRMREAASANPDQATEAMPSR